MSIPWHDDPDAAMAEARTARKPVLVYATGEG
jgi:hypothetical protein